MVWLNFWGPDQHLVIDVSITGVYKDADAVLDDVSRVPGFAAKAREDSMPSWMRISGMQALHGGRLRLPVFGCGVWV